MSGDGRDGRLSSRTTPEAAWVRYVDGRFILTWREPGVTGVQNLPLTRLERLLWQLAKRTPTP